MPTKIIFGKGRVKELNTHIDPEIKKILVVTDKNVAQKSGALDQIVARLKNKDLYVFDEVEENPSLGLVKRSAELAAENQVQLVIGVGGGSPMDAAKGCAVLAVNSGDMKDYMKGKTLERDPLPVVCIPTSSGTGSEVTPYAVFTDPDDNSKGGYGHPSIFPRFSIIDPELTFSMPESVVINTGLDALTHSIEAYLSTEAFELNDVLALHSIEVILKELRAASEKNKEAMSRMAYASMIAGIAITHAGTILLHIMAYPLTVFHQMPHGKANAVLLPAFLEFMKEKSTVKQKVARLEEIFQPVGGVKEFVNSFNISTRLTDYGIQESEFDLFAKKTIVKSDIAITPARITEADILAIYRSAYSEQG
jgi:1,3-propanediol dehydrogenase/alcohol dehydrogenase